MPSTSTSYSSRAKAPFEPLLDSSRKAFPERRTSHRSSSRAGRRGGEARGAGGRGPELEPLTLTAYEPGKKIRREREDSEDSPSSSLSDSSRGSRTDDSETSDGEDEATRSKPERGRLAPPPPSRSSNRTVLYLIFAIILVLFLGAGVYIYRSSQPTSLESTSTNPSSTVVPKTSTIQATSASSTSSMSELDSSDSTASSVAVESVSSSSSSSSPSITTSSTSTASASSESSASDDSAPPSEYSAINRSGTFVPTSSYAIATGTAGYVGDSKANADMSKIQVEPKKELVGDEGKGKIWVGDVTFYAAGKGGYGSCGTKLYDGQDLYFAAMSVYDLMGSASPAPFCYSCISLQSTKDPSKTITAIVADSCPACTLAHVDLEQKAFFALGATVEMGVLTVAWSFVDCPEGWTQKALEGVSEDVYEEVE